MTRQAPLFAAIEAGGTKFVCGLGRGPDEVVATTRLPTCELPWASCSMPGSS